MNFTETMHLLIAFEGDMNSSEDEEYREEKLAVGTKEDLEKAWEESFKYLASSNGLNKYAVIELPLITMGA